MRNDSNKCSPCDGGKEHYEPFVERGKKYYQYDYRANSGELFSCVGKDLVSCRKKRDKWMYKYKITSCQNEGYCNKYKSEMYTL